MRPDPDIEAQVIDVHERFCSAFTDRDPGAVMRLIAPDPDAVVVTSEEALVRGPAELRDFLERYEEGATTYSWDWERRDISTVGRIAWLLAEGTETAASEDGVEMHPYRMTMVLEQRSDRWLLVQVHGSSPH